MSFDERLKEILNKLDDGGCGCCAFAPDLTEQEAITAIKKLIIESLPEKEKPVGAGCYTDQHNGWNDYRQQALKNMGIQHD